jgi:hypothetical protein
VVGLGWWGADHAFYYERARVLLPFRTVIRAHLIQTNFLTSRVGSGSSHSPLPGHFRLRRIIASDEERDYRASSELHRSSAYSQALAEFETTLKKEPNRGRHARRRGSRGKIRRFREDAPVLLREARHFSATVRECAAVAGGTYTNMARSHFGGGCHDRNAERSSVILVFGRIRYGGCDCGRDRTDLM